MTKNLTDTATVIALYQHKSKLKTLEKHIKSVKAPITILPVTEINQVMERIAAAPCDCILLEALPNNEPSNFFAALQENEGTAQIPVLLATPLTNCQPLWEYLVESGQENVYVMVNSPSELTAALAVIIRAKSAEYQMRVNNQRQIGRAHV